MGMQDPGDAFTCLCLYVRSLQARLVFVYCYTAASLNRKVIEWKLMFVSFVSLCAVLLLFSAYSLHYLS